MFVVCPSRISTHSVSTPEVPRVSGGEGGGGKGSHGRRRAEFRPTWPERRAPRDGRGEHARVRREAKSYRERAIASSKWRCWRLLLLRRAAQCCRDLEAGDRLDRWTNPARRLVPGNAIRRVVCDACALSSPPPNFPPSHGPARHATMLDSLTSFVQRSTRSTDWQLSIFSFADPFADAIKGSDDDVQDGLVHIRIQQRNGRKTLTTVQGLSSEYDLKKIVRACKKVSERLRFRSPPLSGALR